MTLRNEHGCYNPSHRNANSTHSNGQKVYQYVCDTDDLKRNHKNGTIDWDKSVGSFIFHKVYGPVKILGVSKKKKRHKIVEYYFVNTGTLGESCTTSVIVGKIKDVQQPSVANVGILGFHESGTQPSNRLYSTWVSMIQRCYSLRHNDYHYYGAKGVTVCERWKRLDYFEQDFKKLEGYQQWLVNRTYQIDKDGKAIKGQPKQYSPNTCQLIPREVNMKIRNTK